MASDQNQNGKTEDGTPQDSAEDIAKSVEEGRTLLDDIRRRNSDAEDSTTTHESDITDKPDTGGLKFNFLRPAIYIALVVAVAGALYYFYEGGGLDDILSPGTPAPDPTAELSADLRAANARVETLERRLDALSTEMGTLTREMEESNQSFSAALETIPQNPVDNSESAARLEFLASELESLRAEMLAIPVTVNEGTGETAASIAALELARTLEERISAIEASARLPGAATTNGSGLKYVAFGSLKASVALSLPFGNELTAFRHAIADDDVIAGLAIELEGFSRTGIPSFPSLKVSFPREARIALTAIKAVDEDASAFDKAWSEITSLVTIRRTGELEGEDAVSVFARAETRLQAGSLDDAVDELSFLPEDAAAAFALWLDDARSRLAAESVLRMIEARLLDAALTPPSS